MDFLAWTSGSRLNPGDTTLPVWDPAKAKGEQCQVVGKDISPRSGFKFNLCYFLAIWLWANILNSPLPLVSASLRL